MGGIFKNATEKKDAAERTAGRGSRGPNPFCGRCVLWSMVYHDAPTDISHKNSGLSLKQSDSVKLQFLGVTADTRGFHFNRLFDYELG